MNKPKIGLLYLIVKSMDLQDLYILQLHKKAKINQSDCLPVSSADKLANSLDPDQAQQIV